jgi:hypothetical protein
MFKTFISGRRSRVAACWRVVGQGRRVRACVGVAAVFAMVGCGSLTVGSQAAAAREKLCQGAFGSIDGLISNSTEGRIKRVFDEHGSTNFWGPEPPEYVQPRATASWCVGSRFGLPAMQVEYLLPGEHIVDTRGTHYVGAAVVHFEAYYEFLTGDLKTACSLEQGSQRGYHYLCEVQRTTDRDVRFLIAIGAA